MECAQCGAAIAQVSGKAGSYYGCLGAAKGECDNKMLVRRKLAEGVILPNFVDFIGEGRGSQALANALVATERRVESFRMSAAPTTSPRPPSTASS